MSEEASPNPGIRASLDQELAYLMDLAPVVVKYYKKLIDEGAPPDLAHAAVLDWHRALNTGVEE